MRDGPALSLTSTLLYEILNDPAFYVAVPAFYFLKAQGLAITEKIKQAILTGGDGCGGCGGLKAAMEPLTVPFIEQLRKLQVDVPAALTPLVDYVARRRNYRPRPILVYYRDSEGRRAGVEL